MLKDEEEDVLKWIEDAPSYLGTYIMLKLMEINNI